MKANLNVTPKDLSGKEVVDERGEVIILSKLLANRIMAEPAQEDVLVRWDLANRLNNVEAEIELGENDKQIIKNICKNGRLPVLVAAQILNIFNK